LQKNHVFISGSNGWIGNAVCKAFQNQKIATEGIDRRCLPNFATQLKVAVATDCLKTVVHCAGLAHQPNNSHLHEMLQANAELPASLAKIARDAGVNTFVLISSAKVMGDVSERGLIETDVCHPNGAYAQSKLAGEIQVKAVLEHSQTRLIIVRPPLVYGPQVRANFLSLMRLAYSGLPLPLQYATQPRSMIYIENLTSIILDLITKSEADGCYLVSDQKSLSTAEWIKRLRIQFAMPPRLFPLPQGLMRAASAFTGQSSKFERLFDPFLLNTNKIAALGIEPKIDISQSIRQTAQWFAMNQKN
jgi:UDP-glucose 4-epimerase